MMPRSQLWYGAPHMRSWRVGAWCTLTLGIVSSLFTGLEAQAKECTNPLVNTCINSDTFWPNPGPTRFATVAGTETVGEGQVGFGLIATYLSRPVVLRVATPGPGGSDQFVVDNQVTGNFLFAYGVTQRLQLDFALPVTFVQTGAGTSPLTGGDDLHDTAVRDLRFGFAYAIVPRDRVSPDAQAQKSSGALTGRMTISAPTGDSSDFAGERSAVFAPSLAGDYRMGIVFAGLEVGARLRPVTEFAGARIGPQLTTALGAGVDVIDHERLSIMAEARSYVNFAEQHDTAQSAFGISSRPNGKSITPAEWMLAVRTAPLLAGDISFLAGGGGPIPIGDPAITVPRFRFLLGAVYAPTARDTDGDGIIDKNDFCPSIAGKRGGERPGCPAEAPPPPDASAPRPATPAENEEKKP
ncbi:MAG: outer membrane protein OmpA [Labilithrix sp.]|nr:outer membrane protein OmpA [Labilithrix sp.]